MPETTEGLRVGAIFIIMCAGALGVFPPVLLRLSEKTMNDTPFMCAKVCGRMLIDFWLFVFYLHHQRTKCDAIAKSHPYGPL